MAQEVRHFSPVIPAGTAKDSPVTRDITFPQREVVAVRWRVPHGPMGTMGFALALSGQVYLPWNDDGWIVADDESDVVPLTGAPNSGAWQLKGYNTGAYDHTVYLTFYLALVGARTGGPISAPLVIPPSGVVVPG